MDWNSATAAEGTWQGAYLARIVPYHDGYVAVGTIIEHRNFTGAAWMSDDGTDWHLAAGSEVDAGTLTGPGVASDSPWAGLFNVAAVGDRIIASGWRRTGSMAHRQEEAIFETSPDGETWVPATIPDQLGTSMLGGRQFIFIARDGTTAWRSTDGTAWSDARLDVPANADPEVQPLLLQLGDGYVALGETFVDDHTARAQLVWTSSDGSSWRLAAETPLDLAGSYDVIATTFGNTIVAAKVFGVPETEGGTGGWGITTSHDGIDWSEPDTVPFVGTWLTMLASDSRSVLLVGFGLHGQGTLMWLAQAR